MANAKRTTEITIVMTGDEAADVFRAIVYTMRTTTWNSGLGRVHEALDNIGVKASG